MPTDVGFTSQRSDSTGLMYFKARYYAQSLGRFVSADTIVPDGKNPQAFNRYSYVSNSPLNYIDPSGHVAQCPDCGGSGVEGIIDAYERGRIWYLERTKEAPECVVTLKDALASFYNEYPGYESPRMQDPRYNIELQEAQNNAREYRKSHANIKIATGDLTTFANDIAIRAKDRDLGSIATHGGSDIVRDMAPEGAEALWAIIDASMLAGDIETARMEQVALRLARAADEAANRGLDFVELSVDFVGAYNAQATIQPCPYCYDKGPFTVPASLAGQLLYELGKMTNAGNQRHGP